MSFVNLMGLLKSTCVALPAFRRRRGGAVSEADRQGREVVENPRNPK